MIFKMSHVEAIYSRGWYINFSKYKIQQYLFWKLANELHDWIGEKTRVIQPPNVSDSLFVKLSGTILKKQKHLLQISVQELHNDIILPIYQGGLLVQELCMEKNVFDIRILVNTCQSI